MSIDYGFDTDEVEIESSSVPPGVYKVTIATEEAKDTKEFHTNGGNRYLECSYEIMEGDHKGLKIFDRFNLWNSSEKAQKIAKETMAKIALATGKKLSKDHPITGRVMLVTVAEQKDNPQYTKVVKYQKPDTPF